MIAFIIIGVVLLFIGCITLLIYRQDDSNIVEKEKLTDDVNIIFNDNMETKDNCLVDNEII